jgi:hypothetical protein
VDDEETHDAEADAHEDLEAGSSASKATWPGARDPD